MKSRTGILFFFLIIAGCYSSEQSGEITILWNDDQATGISIPKKIIRNSAYEELRLVLSGDTITTGIFGNFKTEGDAIVFEPLIPFTKGLSYTLLAKDEELGTIRIPLLDISDNTVVTGIWPSQDTLPENTLKMYISFSKPMKQGEALKHLVLLRNNRDTVNNPFLEMTNELWNANATILTIWFDPGRVKRDLQPNRLLGSPLEKGNRYRLIIDDQWRDVRGSPLASVYSKSFLVGARDTAMPDPQEWKIIAPSAQTLTPLRIEMPEPLDYLLLQSAIILLDESAVEVRGKLELVNEEKEIHFIPDENWKNGTYTLRVESRLEDLSGNNLERPFDRDLNQKFETPKLEKQFKRRIVIQ